METILFCCPHLSTGGLPQYLTKKIELLLDTYNIYVIEYDDVTGGVFVVQKNKIKELINDHLITLPWGSNKQEIINIINKIKPDIIHLEEIPEYFMSDEIAKQIYKKDRKYKIFETSHDSSVNPGNKRFLPDKFILVSKFQVEMLSSLGIDSEVVEYPIEYKERPDRSDALKKLGLDPNFKHVLHVGLYTPRKNQKEFFEYAKNFINDKIIFHSVGNQADNFRDYWEPLMKDKPINVIWHGEKSNVDDFYAAMDLFLFTSKGTINDKETMPLVIREAISWHLPTLIYNLPVYENYFDSYENIKYLQFDYFNDNIKLIKDELHFENNQIENVIDNKNVIIISTYPNTKNVINLTEESIKAISDIGYDIILTSHYPIPIEIQKLVKYCIYDSNNILIRHDFYDSYWYDGETFKVKMNIKTNDNNIYHGPAVYTNYYNGISFANKLGYENAICFNFDMIINNHRIISEFISYLAQNKAVFNNTIGNEGNVLRTVFFGIKTDYFVDNFRKINNAKEYSEWEKEINSPTNGLENIFYFNLINEFSNIKTLTDEEFYTLFKDCKIDICSRAEYFNVLPFLNSSEDEFVVWYSSPNIIDNKNITIKIYLNNEILDNFNFVVEGNVVWYKSYKFKDNMKYLVELFENDILLKSINIDKEYYDNELINNGEFLKK